MRSTIWTKQAMTAMAIATAFASVPGKTLAQTPATTAITTNNARLAETDAGDLVAESVRSALGADIGLVPAAAFKVGASTPRPANGDQAASLVDPGSDTLSLLSLRGDQIIAALERSVSFEPQASSGFLQVAGIRFTYDLRKEDGKRVSAVTVNGQPLEASKRYKVATTKPLAHGQQGYFQIWDKGDISSDSATTMDIAIREFAKSKGGSLSPVSDSRIVSVAPSPK